MVFIRFPIIIRFLPSE